MHTGTVLTPGAVDGRLHIIASWFSSAAVPPRYAAAEVILERPVRMFAAHDPMAKLAVVRAVFEARKLAKSDDPKLVPLSTAKPRADELNPPG